MSYILNNIKQLFVCFCSIQVFYLGISCGGGRGLPQFFTLGSFALWESLPVAASTSWWTTVPKHSEVTCWYYLPMTSMALGGLAFLFPSVYWDTFKSEQKRSRAEALAHAHWLHRLVGPCVLAERNDCKITAFSSPALHHAKQCHSQCRTDRHSCLALVLYPQSISIGSRSAFEYKINSNIVTLTSLCIRE